MIKKGDKVKVLSGKDKKKEGEVIEIDRQNNRAKVKGINIVKKHIKTTKEKKGGIISKENFMAWTLDTWRIQPASAKKVGHPAPFPIELPRRLIELYTYQNDLILDPFCGAGTTALAAKEVGRSYIGYDVDPDYIDLAKKRLSSQ